MTKPERKLVRQFTALVTSASLEGRKRADVSRGRNLPPAGFLPRLSCPGRLHPRRCPLPAPHAVKWGKVLSLAAGAGAVGTWLCRGRAHRSPMPAAAPCPQSSPVAVVVEGVVTGQSEENAEARAQGEENLRGGINPDLAGEATGGLGNGQGVPRAGRCPLPAHPMACPPVAQGRGPCWSPSLACPCPRVGGLLGREGGWFPPWGPAAAELSNGSRIKHPCSPVPGGGMESRGAQRPPCPLCPARFSSGSAALITFNENSQVLPGNYPRAAYCQARARTQHQQNPAAMRWVIQL